MPLISTFEAKLQLEKPHPGLHGAWLGGAQGVWPRRSSKYEQEGTLSTASSCSLTLHFMLRSVSLRGRGKEDPKPKAPVLCSPQRLALLPPSSVGQHQALLSVSRPTVRPAFFGFCGAVVWFLFGILMYL